MSGRIKTDCTVSTRGILNTSLLFIEKEQIEKGSCHNHQSPCPDSRLGMAIIFCLALDWLKTQHVGCDWLKHILPVVMCYAAE